MAFASCLAALGAPVRAEIDLWRAELEQSADFDALARLTSLFHGLAHFENGQNPGSDRHPSAVALARRQATTGRLSSLDPRKAGRVACEKR
jgi:hypothetical protein